MASSCEDDFPEDIEGDISDNEAEKIRERSKLNRNIGKTLDNHPWLKAKLKEGWRPKPGRQKPRLIDYEYSCKHCRPEKTILGKESNFIRHGDSKGHTEWTKTLNNPATKRSAEAMEHAMKKKPKTKKSDEVLKADIEIARSVSQHMALRNADCLVKTFKRNADVLNEVTCSRTKCTSLITNVIAPDLKRQLQENLKEYPLYSLLCDESTDVSCQKLFTVTIRYIKSTQHLDCDKVKACSVQDRFKCSVHREESKVVDHYLGAVPVIRQTGLVLWNALKKLVVEDWGLDFMNMRGFSTDGAANMVGEHNGIWSYVKEAAPYALLLKCTCHSYDLCVKAAYNHENGSIPGWFHVLMTDIPSWFTISPIRRHGYEQIRKTVVDSLTELEELTKGMPQVFKTFCKTRWLSHGPLMKNIKAEIKALRKYFESCCVQKEGELKANKTKAQVILNNLNLFETELYLSFLTSVIPGFERINKLFQASKKVDYSDLFREMRLHFDSLKARFMRHNQMLDPQHTHCDYGAEFITICSRVLRDVEAERTPSMSQEEISSYETKIVQTKNRIKEVKHRCHKFLQVAYEGLQKRMPTNFKIYENCGILSDPAKIYKTVEDGGKRFADLPLDQLMTDKDVIEDQLRLVKQENLTSLICVEDLEDPVKFGVMLLYMKRTDGSSKYRELGLYLLSAQVLPVSNAFCESVFSIIGWVKNKHRNRMKLKTLNAIMRVKVDSYHKLGCCNDGFVTPEMISLHNEDKYEHVRKRKEEQRKKKEKGRGKDKENEKDVEKEKESFVVDDDGFINIDPEDYAAETNAEMLLVAHETQLRLDSELLELIMFDIPQDFNFN